MDATYRGHGTSQLPLAGAVLCCTSIGPEQRSELGAIGAQMGATIKLDLTSDVTHLIVGSIGSAKYRYVARSREDVKVLPPKWLHALRAEWIEGHDDVDVAKLEKQYRLPTFYGLKICVTSFNDPEQRRQLQDVILGNGAEYHGDLTKAVTHLIAASPLGKKYEHALNWRLKIVSLEWLEQSIERGMILEEILYNPTMHPEERGIGAWERLNVQPPNLGKRTRGEQSQAVHSFRRKLRRSASTKMGTQSEALWAGITAVGHESQLNEEDNWSEELPVGGEQRHRELSQTGDGSHLDQAGHDSALSHEFLTTTPKAIESHNGIFQGRFIFLHGFDREKTNILQTHLDGHGARVIQRTKLNTLTTDELRPGYLVVPHDTQSELADLPDHARSALTLATNWWVERCLHGKRLFDPANDILCKPFKFVNIDGFSDLTINSTGFAGIELLHTTKVVALMGATYTEQLSAKTSVMICSTHLPNKTKLQFALRQGVPVVHATWLWECLRTGDLQPFDDHVIRSQVAPQPQRPIPQQRRSLPLTKPLSRPLPLKEADTAQSTSGQQSMDSFGFDGHASLTLQDIRSNSPRRPSLSSTSVKSFSARRSESTDSTGKPSSDIRKPEPAPHLAQKPDIPAQNLNAPAAPAAPVHEEKDYSEMLAKLRANRKAAPASADAADDKRRRRRQLGRVMSTHSDHSANEGSGQISLDSDEDEDKPQPEEYQPSQELGWDSLGAAKAREQMIKRLGGTLHEKSVPVQGIGMVKDVVSEMSGRVGRKRRAG